MLITQVPGRRILGSLGRVIVIEVYKCHRGKREGGNSMQALIYHGPGQKQWESKSDPKIEDPTDAIVKIDTTTICGTDLHILKGDVPAVTEGRTLGHEAVGTVVETRSEERRVGKECR